MILILGGTTEGRIAAQTLEEAGNTFYYSTKGDEQEVHCTTVSACKAPWTTLTSKPVAVATTSA